MARELPPFAFPGEIRTPEGTMIRSTGMTLRDWFAGQALAGLCSWHLGDLEGKPIAAKAYSLADAMLAAREGK